MTLNAAGDLSYTVAPNTNGTATVVVSLSDDGSGVPPNENTSAGFYEQGGQVRLAAALAGVVSGCGRSGEDHGRRPRQIEPDARCPGAREEDRNDPGPQLDDRIGRTFTLERRGDTTRQLTRGA